ncbi:MAG TPA: DEAD/DEAH box helicase, partial [Myxococcota bacterium]|nr:DEAD/DEAH box helicase [Myxococcota bacterium]
MNPGLGNQPGFIFFSFVVRPVGMSDTGGTMQYRGFELDPFQETSITALSEGRSVLVSAPTGTGKTLIADFVVERALAHGRSVIYTAPAKALSNQKYRDWCRLHGEDK